MTENDLRPCPFCGHNAEQPIKNLDMFTCTNCILYSESAKISAVTGKFWKRAYCWKEIERLQSELTEAKSERDANKQQSNSWAEVATKAREELEKAKEWTKELLKHNQDLADKSDKAVLARNKKDAEIERYRKALKTIKSRECECYLVGDSTCCHFEDQEVAEAALSQEPDRETGEKAIEPTRPTGIHCLVCGLIRGLDVEKCPECEGRSQG